MPRYELHNVVRRELPGKVRLLPHRLDAYFVAMAFPSGSPLREPADRAVLDVTDSDRWERAMEQHLAAGD